ncbi:unnamed protein product [Cercopithifilaria johnstoni]|uniref:RING-type domain-containing protein n=1 Tax=Cercopithifilaria johnstoni TaxID=2874296 RepID=A0A8J2MQN6_9BILA|nr:unnamed protein product [Cercopithifilaria johnstoni]
MVDIIGSCVIGSQNLCINNFSSLPCGHTFHYKCVMRWLLYSEQCPTCRAHTSARNIVKRLYFANCDDKAMNGVGTSGIAAVTDYNNKSASTANMNDSACHGNAESYNNNSGYDSDSEDGVNRTDDDFTDSNSANMENNDSITESEEENEEELKYQETVSDADMVSVLDVSGSVTSSDSLETFSESFSEIDDAASVSSVDHDNMEISELLDDHGEVSNDDDNIYTSLLLIEHIGSDSSDDDDSCSSGDSDDNNDDCDLTQL